MTDLLVVGAGPAGRALAHRALVRGLTVTLVDPAPERPWTATFGAYRDELPPWLPSGVISAQAPHFTVFTPARREIDRPYCILAADRLQSALSLDGARIVADRVTELTGHTVRLSDGGLLTADHVIDARGASAGGPEQVHAARQTAFGTFHRSGERRPNRVDDGPVPDSDAMVLMDWRPAADGRYGDATFSYRVDLGNGTRLIEETCLAGRPAIGLTELARRNALRSTTLRPEVTATGECLGTEEVDFPLHPGPAPWRSRGPVRFGAAGGLMHPATGYSLGASLGAVDELARALVRGEDPRDHLWSRSARWTYRLRLLGLGVLLGFRGPELIAFFDTFFALPAARQRGYLSGRESFGGTAAAMWAVFAALPVRRRLRLVRLFLSALLRR